MVLGLDLHCPYICSLKSIKITFHFSGQLGARSSVGTTSSLPGVFLQKEAHPMEDPDESSSEDEEQVIDPPIQRDDLRNPFWIEDKEVLNGPRGHLKMDEIEFWKGMRFYSVILLYFWISFIY